MPHTIDAGIWTLQEIHRDFRNGKINTSDAIHLLTDFYNVTMSYKPSTPYGGGKEAAIQEIARLIDALQLEVDAQTGMVTSDPVIDEPSAGMAPPPTLAPSGFEGGGLSPDRQVFIPESNERFRDDDLRLALFQQAVGLPGTRPVNPFQQFQQDQFSRVSSAFDVERAMALAGGDLNLGGQGFAQYLNERIRPGAVLSAVGRGQFGRMANLSVGQQQAAIADLGEESEQALINRRITDVVAGGLGGRYARRIAGPEARAAFDISPTTLAGEDTFVSYLQRKYGL
jgi:hypothetical protein